MTAKMYLTITAILSILYAVGFILMPGQAVVLFGGPAESHVMLNLQFFGGALVALAVTQWFAKDFPASGDVRGVLIGAAVGDAVIAVISIWGIFQSLLNSLAWVNVIVVVLLLLGALYCLSTNSLKLARI